MSLQKQLFSSLVALIVLISAIAGGSYRFLSRQAEQNALVQLHYRIAGLSGLSGNELDEHIAGLLDQSEAATNSTSVVALYQNGSVSEPMISPPPDVSDNPAGRDYHADGEHVYGTWIDLGDNRFLFLGELSAPYYSVAHYAVGLIILSGVLTACVLFGFAFFAQRRLSRDLSRFVRAARRVGEGALEERVPEPLYSSDLKEIAAHVNDMIGKLQLLLADAQTLSQTLSHDLRNYISHARIHLQDLRNAHGPKESESSALIQRSLDALTSLDQVAAEIARLSLETAQAGSQGSRRTQDLAPIVRQAVDLYAPVFEDHQFEVECALKPAFASVGSGLVLEILSNLLTNVLKYDTLGKKLEIYCYTEKGHSKILVRDRGPGVPADKMQAIFQLGVRLAPKGCEEGSGYGLAIARLLARINGGQLTAGPASPGALNPGLCMCLEFPEAQLPFAGEER